MFQTLFHMIKSSCLETAPHPEQLALNDWPNVFHKMDLPWSPVQ